ncbi:DNA replication initiation factor cdc45, partial [Kickxella alabastrina]
MVYVPSSKYEDAYQRIVAGASHSSGTSVVIFASTADGDTLCGLRILTGLLKRDAIGHKIVPISSYADIVQMNAKLVAANAQIRTLVFLNCGATVDIQDYVTLRDSLTVVIVDSHRPFNLYNVYWNDQVQCLDDGEVEESMAEMQKAFEEIEFGDDDDDGEDD